MTGIPASGARERVVSDFARRFGHEPAAVVRAPGRVNLIGDHTDYSDGFVLPMAIEPAVWIAMRPTPDRVVTVRSLDFDDELSLRLDLPMRRDAGAATDWRSYMAGVAWSLGDGGATLSGWEGVVAGDLPIGAGLASSAAIELATARAFAVASGVPWDAREMALTAVRAEREWVGVNCGVMDQLIVASGVEGHAMLLDCRSLDATLVPLPAGAAVVVLDTGTRRELAASEYNSRRAQCAAAATALGARALRDIGIAELEAAASGGTTGRRTLALDALSFRRARHVVTENARTVACAAALARGDAAEAGRLMQASHASLRDDFEVSSPELDLMVSVALERAECHGARMTGAGFGGCAVGLVAADAVPSFVAAVTARYARETGLAPALIHCAAARGASVEPLPAR